MQQKLKLLSTKQQIRSFFGEYPLVAASIRVTNACNLRCPHCYTNGGLALMNELKLPEMKSVIDQLANLKTLYIFFTGGEPFIRRDIEEILKYTNNKRIGIAISTNGQLISRQLLEHLKGLNFTLFQISLDGTEKIHNYIRGKNVWNKAIKAIKLAKSILKKNIGVGAVIMKKNWMVLDKVLSEAVRNGADIFAPIFLIVTGRADNSLNPSPKEHLECLRRVFNRYKSFKSKVKFAKNTTIPPALVPKEWRNKGLHMTFAPCSFPYCIGINANGDVAPCDGFFNCPEMIVGNIREKSLIDIWNNSKLLKEMRKINPSDLRGVCKKCIYRDYCAGGCRANAYIKYKNLTMPDPVCQSIYDSGLFPKDCLR
ncbi:MAG: radical SAM protein [Candidatus Aenigmatarchaeota archaeon]